MEGLVDGLRLMVVGGRGLREGLPVAGCGGHPQGTCEWEAPSRGSRSPHSPSAARHLPPRRPQVDVLKFEPFIDSFVEGLGLDQGYTLIVANPKWSTSLASYGFRAGFSQDELTMLQMQVGGGGGRSLTWCKLMRQ